MNTQSIATSLLPVAAVIAVGWLAGRLRWLTPQRTRRLSTLVFLVLAPPLLFNTMSSVHLERLDARPVLAYFGASFALFFATLALRGADRRGTVLGMATTYSNLVMIGIPLVALGYGQAGLVTLFTLVALHALLLLTTATVALELAVLREARAQADDALEAPRGALRTVALAVRNAIVHPVPLPILLGLAFAQTGWALPAVLDTPLRWLGLAFGPLALLLVGATLAAAPLRGQMREALGLVALKNLLHPLLVAALALALGVRGVPLAVLVLAGALPVGANVFLFSQRYRVEQQTITATVALSTVAAALTLPLVMGLIALL